VKATPADGSGDLPTGAPAARACRGSALQNVLRPLAFLLVAVNLRPAIASVGPVLDQVVAGVGLTGLETTVVTAAPIFCFGIFAPVAGVLLRRCGMRRALLLCTGLIGAGLFLRVVPGAGLFLAGTFLAAMGVASCNVLLPAVIKGRYPERPGPAMGLYTVALTGAASVAAATSAPLSRVLPYGWRAALGIWALPTIAAVFVISVSAYAADAKPRNLGQSLLASRCAWCVTAYFGLQSLDFYATLVWLAPILRTSGASANRAGLLLSLCAAMQLPVGLFVPVLASRMRTQVPLVLLTAAFSTLGIGGLIAAATWSPWLWIVMLGVGQGIGFPLALTCIVLRSRSPQDTAALSSMTQSLGYIVAGLGPLLVGALHTTGSWKPSLVLLQVLVVVQVLPGLVAARPGYVRDIPTDKRPLLGASR